MVMLLKVGIAAIAIGFASWLGGKKPELAGFIIAMPLASILALAFSYWEHHNPAASITFAKSILVGVPVSWLFFLPFFCAEKFGLGFWASYGVGLTLLVFGYLLHQQAMRLL